MGLAGGRLVPCCEFMTSGCAKISIGFSSSQCPSHSRRRRCRCFRFRRRFPYHLSVSLSLIWRAFFRFRCGTGLSLHWHLTLDAMQCSPHTPASSSGQTQQCSHLPPYASRHGLEVLASSSPRRVLHVGQAKLDRGCEESRGQRLLHSVV